MDLAPRARTHRHSPRCDGRNFGAPTHRALQPAKADLPVEFGPDKNVRWKTEIPPGGSSPCIWEDRIFLTGYDSQAKKLEVICIDRSNGKILWRRDVEAKTIEKVHAASTPANATPTTDGERVYAYFGSRGLLCYDFAGESGLVDRHAGSEDAERIGHLADRRRRSRVAQSRST